MDKTSEPEAVSYLRRIILGGAYPTNADLLAIDPWDIIDYIDRLRAQQPQPDKGE